MGKRLVGLALLLGSSTALAAPPATDFGIRTVPGIATVPSQPTTPAVSWTKLTSARGTSLASAVVLASQWGTVTSTRRTPVHNRVVGGARNSYHLSGRAIDIARHSGVRHRDIEAAYVRAGYRLIESLDEGDHSHFAFGWGTAPASRQARTASVPKGSRSSTAVASTETKWRVVFAPRSSR